MTSETIPRSPHSEEIFERGPFLRVLELMGGGRPYARYLRGATVMALVAWLPLLLLSFLHDGLRAGPNTITFLKDAGSFARFLVALPVLVLADEVCGRRLTAIARYFLEGGLIDPADRPRLQRLLASTRDWSSSPLAAVGILACLVLITFALFKYVPKAEMPAWNGNAEDNTLTPAGWWHTLVAAQLLMGLLLAWIWRLFVWTRYLWHLAHFPMKLSAAHPDKAAGLLFLGHSVIAFAPVGFAVGSIFAGLVANHVWYKNVPLMSFRMSAAGVVLSVLAVVGAPLLVFMRRLALEWTSGIQLYGRLASRFAVVFEEKWFRQKFPVDPETLDAGDFSAAIDLSSYAQNAYQMHVYPADIRSFLFLAVTTALPLVPVIVFSIPLTMVLDTISKAIF